MEDIEALQKELQQISHRIYELKTLMESTKYPELQKELKQLRWQALFYLIKIENLKRQGETSA